MNVYFIFDRTSAYQNPRVLWHKIRVVQARSRPDAMRRFFKADGLIDQDPDTEPMGRSTNATRGVDCFGAIHLLTAERSDRIDFEHYNFDGTYTEAS